MDRLSSLTASLLCLIGPEEQPTLGDGLAALGEPPFCAEVLAQKAKGLGLDQIDCPLPVALTNHGNLLGAETNLVQANRERLRDPNSGVSDKLEQETVPLVLDDSKHLCDRRFGKGTGLRIGKFDLGKTVCGVCVNQLIL
ncbi:hypothetical protein D3C86_1748500 [compost metagenome]